MVFSRRRWPPGRDAPIGTAALGQAELRPPPIPTWRRGATTTGTDDRRITRSRTRAPAADRGPRPRRPPTTITSASHRCASLTITSRHRAGTRPHVPAAPTPDMRRSKTDSSTIRSASRRVSSGAAHPGPTNSIPWKTCTSITVSEARRAEKSMTDWRDLTLIDGYEQLAVHVHLLPPHPCAVAPEPSKRPQGHSSGRRNCRHRFYRPVRQPGPRPDDQRGRQLGGLGGLEPRDARRIRRVTFGTEGRGTRTHVHSIRSVACGSRRKQGGSMVTEVNCPADHRATGEGPQVRGPWAHLQHGRGSGVDCSGLQPGRHPRLRSGGHRAAGPHHHRRSPSSPCCSSPTGTRR